MRAVRTHFTVAELRRESCFLVTYPRHVLQPCCSFIRRG